MDTLNSKNKLEILRNSMRANGVGGVIVPHTDRYRNEHKDYEDSYLYWLTGFTGSAGLAVVTASSAALFVDSRYTLQAASEVDSLCFEVLHSAEHLPTDWLASKLKGSDDKYVLIDSWSYSCAEAKSLVEALLLHNIVVRMEEGSIIDELLSEKFVNKKAVCNRHPVNFSGETSLSKLSRVCDAINYHGANAMIITDPLSICWLLNIRGNASPCVPVVLCHAIVYPEGAVDLFFDAEASKSSFDDDPDSEDGVIRVIPMDLFSSVMKNKFGSGSLVVFDYRTVPIAVKLALEEGEVLVKPVRDVCLAGKAVKNKTEIDGAINVHIADGFAVSTFLAWLESCKKDFSIKTMTESMVSEHLYKIRQDVCDKFPKIDFMGNSFPSIVAFSANAAMVHYVPAAGKDIPLNGDGLLLVDSGGQYLNGTTDVTRTISIGKCDQEHRFIFTLVLKGLIEVSKFKFPRGRKFVASALDIIARRYLWGHGFDYGHSTGHGVGSYLSVHEFPPTLSSSNLGSEFALEPGMIFSCEPGYYRSQSFGMRLENLLTVQEEDRFIDDSNGSCSNLCSFRTLTLAPIDKTLIDVSALTDSEVSWVDVYHSLVWEKLSPFIDDDVFGNWLKEACSPLMSKSAS